MRIGRWGLATMAIVGVVGGCGPRGEYWGAADEDRPETVSVTADAIPPGAVSSDPDPRCPEGMVHVAGGEFRAGARGEDIDFYADWPGTEHLPRTPQTRRTDPFCIDRYEYPNLVGELPKAYVSWDDAVRLCRERGWRLCTEDEWTRACAGTDGWRYPYGDSHVEGNCNADVNERVGDPTWLRPAGAFPRCVSPDGAFDLEGNLSEWVDAVSAEHADQRFVRGGTMWVGVYGRGCFARHRHHHADASHEDDGFRCCSEPVTDADEGSTPAAP